jgi:hypothetical protein
MPGDFHGLPTRSIANRHLRLDFLTAAGPRIVRLVSAGSDQNLLAEVPDLHWTTPFGEYYPRGGHRLCHAPEAFPRSYVPDNEGLTVEEVAAGVRLTAPPEPPTGIRKSIEVVLPDDRPAAILSHRLHNEGAWPVQLAPWAITQMRLGGTAVVAQRAPGSPTDGLLPDRHLVLWPYSHWKDERLHVEDDCVLVRGDPRAPALKLGLWSPVGSVGYLHAGGLFLKRFEPLTGLDYPDRGCNVEIYCNERVLELETLGPLQRLEPGQCAMHVETWELHPDPALLLPERLPDVLQLLTG